ncbi:MAG: hypothetical protein L0214_01490 [candidate division NC10 bacterium]|nr:hypothetical protein [candidate division NC10 bacterium]
MGPTPITATTPALALLFGFLLQRRTEVITPRVVAGTLAIVAGEGHSGLVREP